MIVAIKNRSAHRLIANRPPRVLEALPRRMRNPTTSEPFTEVWLRERSKSRPGIHAC